VKHRQTEARTTEKEGAEMAISQSRQGFQSRQNDQEDLAGAASAGEFAERCPHELNIDGICVKVNHEGTFFLELTFWRL
jgi:hypothetical protein